MATLVGCLSVLIIYLITINRCDSSWETSSTDSDNRIPYGHRKQERLYVKFERPIAILGLPFAKGQEKEGADKAPAEFRKQNLTGQIQRLGYEQVIDYGDLQFNVDPRDKQMPKNNFTEIHNQHTVANANKQIEQKTAEIVAKGETLVLLGGDHSITAGAILGDQKVNKDICMIYVDAHGDINTCESSIWPSLHGFPISFVIKEMEGEQQNYKSCPAMRALKPTIGADSVAILANRDLDDAELDLINKYNITHYSMKDIDDLGIREVMRRTLSTVCGQKSKIHVSFDIDSLDTLYTPNTGTTTMGGLTVREALQMGEMVAETKKLSVIGMYEVNPLLEPKAMAERTTNIAMNIILAFLGKSREVYWAHAGGSPYAEN